MNTNDQPVYDLENEHPVWRWLLWHYAVNDDETRDDYTDWVAEKIEASKQKES